MALSQYEKAHIALLAQIAKATERIADAIETFNATDPLQAIERALEEPGVLTEEQSERFGDVLTRTERMKSFADKDYEYGSDIPESERWRLG
jgi:hypothetical protein